MDNKKNTILLTVIAVATLLVAVVGATFAYFTASEGEGKSTNIIVKTGTGSNSAFTVSETLSLYADQNNFAQDETSKQGVSTGTVEWTAPGSTAEYTPTEAQRTFCYTVSLIVDTNTFLKKDAANADADEKTQLLFNIYRGVGAEDGTTGTETEITSGVGSLTYVSSNVKGVSTTTKGSYVDFTGFDITTAAKGTYQVGGEYKMIAPETKGGAEVKKMTDTWTAKITLVNLNEDQNYNTNKSFLGSLKFAQCGK